MVITADGDGPVARSTSALVISTLDWSSTATIVPLQLLSWRLANLRGLEPGSFRGRAQR